MATKLGWLAALSAILGACSAPPAVETGLAVAVVTADGTADVRVLGLRRVDEPGEVEVGDPWHLGSNTKAMTATVAAMLVQDGVIDWSARAADVLNVSEPTADLGPASLEQLLTHTAGTTADLPGDLPMLWDELWKASPDQIIGLRRSAAQQILQGPSEFAAGTGFAYSNAGYVVAGAMLEAATGMSWEDLVQTRLFEPLGMACGFGAPPGPNAPWGHRMGRSPEPIAPGPLADNPAVLGPAGTVHCDMASWARFAALHLRGAKGDTELLDGQHFHRMHTPPPWVEGSNYAYGWIAVERDWANGIALTHTGSNTLWTATAWLAPELGVAYLAATNVGGAEATLDGKIAELLTAG